MNPRFQEITLHWFARDLLLLLFCAGSCACQTEDARALLHDVAEAARNATSYRAAGHTDDDVLGGLFSRDRGLAFEIVTRAPSQMHMEVTGGPEWANGFHIQVVCDGTGTGWAYYPKHKTYSKITPSNGVGNDCLPSMMTSFADVDQNIKSALVSGNDRVRFENRLQPCIVVQAQYRAIDDFSIMPGVVVRIGRVSRTMCIDPVRKLILRDHLDADMDAGPAPDHVTETITYDSIERNPNLSPALFEFEPPAGATLLKPGNSSNALGLAKTLPSAPSSYSAFGP